MRTPLLAVAGTLVVFTALMGFLHTPAGARTWGAVTGKSCPFGGGMSARQRDVARAAQARMLVGPNPAHEKIGLGFMLDKSTRDDVEAWAQQAGATCAKARTSGELECTVAEMNNLPSLDRPIGTMFFDFDAQAKLKRVTAQVSLLDAEQATRALAAAAENIQARAGGEVIFAGENTPAYLTGMLTQAKTQFHYSDFYAKAQVTHIGENYVLEQTYESLTF